MKCISRCSLSVIFLLALSLSNSHAQPQASTLEDLIQLPKSMDVLPYAKSGRMHATQKTTSNGGSLIAEYSGQTINGVTVRNADSFIYQYSSGRGGDYRTKTALPFDTSIKWMSADSLGGYLLQFRTCKRYDANGKLSEELKQSYQNGT